MSDMSGEDINFYSTSVGVLEKHQKDEVESGIDQLNHPDGSKVGSYERDQSFLNNNSRSSNIEGTVVPLKRKRGRAKLILTEEERRIRKDKRRHDCKVNQRRYRDKKLVVVQEMEDVVDALRKDTKSLEQFNTVLQSRIVAQHGNKKGFEARSVNNYYNTFKWGIHLSDGQQKSSQLDFLKAIFLPDLKMGDVVGLDHLILQWEKYSVIFGSIQMFLDPDGIRVHGNSDVIESAGAIKGVVTRNTITWLCPDILNDEVLVQALMGKNLVVPMKLTFYFDEVARVTRFDVCTDFITAFVKILKNIEHTLKVTKACQISEEGFIQTPLEYMRQKTLENPRVTELGSIECLATEQLLLDPSSKKNVCDSSKAPHEKCTVSFLIN